MRGTLFLEKNADDRAPALVMRLSIRMMACARTKSANRSSQNAITQTLLAASQTVRTPA